MKRMKIFKRIFVFALAVIMCCGASISVLAAENEDYLTDGYRRLELTEEELDNLNESIQPREPAPGLSSITINGLYVDENNKILVRVDIMGTAKSVLCWCNNMQCKLSSETSITSGNKVVGSKMYFESKITYAEAMSGMVINARAQATNAVSPWNTLTTSRTYTTP